MTINVARAINRYTGTTAGVKEAVAGSYGDDNTWDSGGFTDSIQTLLVGIPVGNPNHEGIYGNRLEIREEGERQSEYMQFVTTIELTMRSIVSYRGKDFKVVRTGDFVSYGYQTSIGRWGEGE